MVDESDRVWINLDYHSKALSDHCARITKLEQTHFDSNRLKDRAVTIILGIVVVVQFAVLLVDKLASI